MSETQLNSETLARGQILREPVGFENGYWVGAPEVFYAADEKACYLTYRIRRPRGVAPDRGGEARIARSTDFQNFQDVWSVTKDQFRTASIERCALRKGPDGLWRYFACFVDPADGRWRAPAGVPGVSTHPQCAAGGHVQPVPVLRGG